MLNKNVSILLIDDNDITREVLRVVLRSEGYNVVGEATDGGTGLDMALKLRPHIILLDVVMPKISGLEILPKIKEMLPEAMVLMVTASKDSETVSEAVKAGIHGFILKPFNAQKILDTVEGVVAKIK
ncbi:response regulator transcription factor [Undibacterium jejuense]|uniref:Response regulator transcription factor n=1 Tax=Undibacterium jejuense TaxID=1344949 RepID=A0A923HCH7_9BURK|nr:response regulator transcription factor [Undibacterium jejuense]MBC3861436.1 response regulator transcription factor [Undibacterium jejuense]